MTDKPRVFLDANILIRGITFPRFPYEVLRHAANGDFALLLSPIVLDSARFYVHNRFPDYQEALEMSYENILQEAKWAIQRRKRPA